MFEEDNEIEEDETLKLYRESLKQVMSTPNGRMVMFQQLMLSRVFSNTFDKDSHLHAHYAGMKSVGIETMNTLKSVCYDSYMMMMKENEDA
jgi:hypothetical protein